MAALIIGCLGVVASWIVGTRFAGIDTMTVFWGVGASNIAGMTALLTTLKLERTHWIRTRVLRGSIPTWIVFLSLYFGILVGFCPILRNWDSFILMIVPLIMTTGFTILAFGPIQDRRVARDQRRQRLHVGTTR